MFTQRGGVQVLDESLYLSGPSGVAIYSLSGGSLNLSGNEFVGWQGNTTVTQTGGTHCGNIAGSMEHTNNFHPLPFHRKIEYEVVMEAGDGPKPAALQARNGDFPPSSNLRQRCQSFKGSKHRIEHPVGGVTIVASDELPDIPEILPGGERKSCFRHVASSGAPRFSGESPFRPR